VSDDGKVMITTSFSPILAMTMRYIILWDIKFSALLRATKRIMELLINA